MLRIFAATLLPILLALPALALTSGPPPQPLPAHRLAQVRVQDREEPVHATVTLRNGAMNPRSVTIDRGQTVRFTNRDDHDYSLQAVNRAFSSDTIKPGASWTHTFDRPGRFEYRCLHRPRARGTIEVRE